MIDQTAVAKIARLEREVARLRSTDSSSGRDVLGAIARYKTQSIYGMVGIRGLWARYNKNAFIDGSNRFQFSPSGGSDAIKDSRGFLKTEYLQSSTQYLFSNNATDGNFFTLDNGVTNWNQNPGVCATAWIYIPTSHPANDRAVMSCWNAQTTQASWRLYVDNGGVDGAVNGVRFNVSSTGSFESGQSVGAAIAIPVDKWVFVAGRYTPSTELSVFTFYDNLLQDKDTNTTSIVSGLYNTGTLWNFIGNQRGGSGTNNSFEGFIAYPSLFVTALTDVEIAQLFWVSKSIVGV